MGIPYLDADTRMIKIIFLYRKPLCIPSVLFGYIVHNRPVLPEPMVFCRDVVTILVKVLDLSALLKPFPVSSIACIIRKVYARGFLSPMLLFRMDFLRYNKHDSTDKPGVPLLFLFHNSVQNSGNTYGGQLYPTQLIDGC